VELVSVVSAAEMYEAVLGRASEADIFIAAAAVADYAPANAASQKIKKVGGELALTLERTKDILAAVAALPVPPFTVGFAAETNDMRDNAQKKLAAKSLDMIAGNDVARTDIGFNSDANSLSVFWRGGGVDLEKAPKVEIARRLLELVAERYGEKHPAPAAR
jgi:phosphopantothenoylcysteine decarboxylase/phosphopantothenate--cysteine ligase